MKRLRIGILGGMGPRATVEFERRLLAQFSGNDQEIPEVICINNGAIPDRSTFISQPGGGDPLLELASVAARLRSLSVDIVCMPCNTAHSSKILARLMAVVPLPVVDMPAATVMAAEGQDLKRLLILGTEGTRASQVFDSRATSAICMYPSRFQQLVVNDVIANIKSTGAVPVKLQQDLRALCQSELGNYDAIVLGCTELSLVPSKVFRDFRVFDSLDILAQRCAYICNALCYNETDELKFEEIIL